MMKMTYKRLFLGLISLTLISCKPQVFEDKAILQWETAEWSSNIESHEGNPFDIEANVTFTNDASGTTVKTAMFFDGNNTWKFRFTGTEQGTWQFETTSDTEALEGLTGQVIVKENPDHQKHGFMKNIGGRWGWQGTNEVFVPQYVMGKNPNYYYDFENDRVDEEKIDADIREFVKEHGFTGFHFKVRTFWFDLETEDIDGDVGENPDPRSFRVLETIVQKVHDLGGACHFWMWGADGRNDDKGGPGGIIGGAMNDIDQRNLRYIAARLGPVPGWSMGYGFDTENGWATKEQLNNWKSFLEDRMGWDHFLGARVSYDDKGLWALTKNPPKPPLDEKNNAPIGDEYVTWLGGDYIGYTSYRPMYNRYREAMQHQPQKPSFEEDRFRLRNRPNWEYKDYNLERTRRGLWNSVMAGGVANIWGNLLPEENHGGSQPYDIDTIHIKHQIKTYSLFFEDRFTNDMDVIELLNSPELRCLKNPDNTRIIFYQEDTDHIETTSLNPKGNLPAVAIDTKRAYEEIKITPQSGDTFSWKAPYKSDWAIAIGTFK